MRNTTIDNIADYFLYRYRECGECLTNLKLQKLVYYSQAWYLANKKKPLFNGKFEAWIHGPVNYKLYKRFKKYKWRPITHDVDLPKLPPKIVGFLDEIINAYGDETAYSLERMTHHERPWAEARRDLEPDESSSKVISEEVMKEYYGSRINN